MSVYDIFPVKEVSGDIVTFEDGADGIPMESLSAVITPTQDLHGYATPWPGGGGKNLFPLTEWFQAGYTSTYNGVTMTINADGSVTLSGTASPQTDFYFSRTTGGLNQNPLYLPEGTYTLTMTGTQTGGVKLVVSGSGQNGFPYSEATPVGTAKTGAITDATHAFNYFLLRITNGTVSDGTYYIQLESGSTATAWEPYANICPISGLTGLSVYRTGKNLFDEVWERGAISTATGESVASNTSIRTANYIPLAGGQSYYWSWQSQQSLYMLLFTYKKDKTFSRYVGAVTAQRTITLNSDEAFIRFYIYNNTTEPDWMQISEGSTATTYEPYNGNAYAVDWSTQAGTVYHGTVDPVAGQLTVDKSVYRFTGSESWTLSGTSFFYTFITEGLASASGYFDTENGVHLHYNTSNGQVRVYIDGQNPFLSTSSDMQDYFPSDIGFLYTLATPVTYQLTPQEIITLLWLNNVWATVAPITVKYHAQAQTENVRIDRLFVDGVDMQADGWFLKWRKLAAPKPKTDYISVWGRDGDIDLTENESDGQVFYENRNLMMDMVYIGEDWIEAYSELLDMLHGKECMVQFSNDPYWYWAGRIIASLYEHKPHSLAMSGIMFPYKLSVAKVIESATVNGLTESNAVDVVLPGSRMRVSPKVTVTAGSGDSVTLKWGDNTQALSAGTYYVRGLKVGSDDVTIKVYGTGTVNFEYRKGML